MSTRAELQQRLDAAAKIIEGVDARCVAADGAVSSFGDEVTDKEARALFVLASGGPASELRRALKAWAPSASGLPRKKRT
jgi:hypothetical protein